MTNSSDDSPEERLRWPGPKTWPHDECPKTWIIFSTLTYGTFGVIVKFPDGWYYEKF